MQTKANIKVYKTDNIKKVYKYIYKHYRFIEKEYDVIKQIKHHHEDKTPIYYIAEVNSYFCILQGGSMNDAIKYIAGYF